MAPHDSRDPRGLLPLRPAIFSVLAALRGGPTHGYGILERVNRELGERAIVGPGTLYRTLKEMRDQGLVEYAPPPAADPDPDGRRQYYRSTAFGGAVCEAEARRIAALLVGSGLDHLVPDSSR